MFHLETVGKPLKAQAKFRRFLEREKIIFSPQPPPQNIHRETRERTSWSTRFLRNNLTHHSIKPLAGVVELPKMGSDAAKVGPRAKGSESADTTAGAEDPEEKWPFCPLPSPSSVPPESKC